MRGVFRMGKQMQQVKLVTTGGRQMTTWVDARPDLKRGVVIVLDKIPGVKWLVEELYDTKVDSDLLDLNRGWTNNI
jgi:hypothetical protein